METSQIIKSEEDKAIAELREMLKPGDKVWTVLRHVSASGMSRTISPIVLGPSRFGGELRPLHIDYLMAKAFGFKRAKDRRGLKVGGCGMDMDFSIVYDLSRGLFPDGFDCIGKDCPANDHRNGEDVKHHRDGGYALRQEWL